MKISILFFRSVFVSPIVFFFRFRTTYAAAKKTARFVIKVRSTFSSLAIATFLAHMKVL